MRVMLKLYSCEQAGKNEGYMGLGEAQLVCELALM